jgi:dolichol-phosphate mannosyltransferase
MAAPTNRLVSIVVPAYCEEANLRHLVDEIRRVLDAEAVEWELVLVDDGSADATWERIQAAHYTDQRVQGLRLSRNFGHQHALLAGLTRARGDAVIMMDADLQHPPEVIPRLLEQWYRGAKIVHTVRTETEQASFFKRATSNAYYRIFSLLSGVDLSPGMADFRLLDRQVLDELLQFREMQIFFRGLVEWVGYPSARVSFRAAARYAGTTKYTVRRMVKFAWAGITSFSVIPLRLGIFLGLATSSFSLLYLMHAVWLKLFHPERAMPGWASIVGLITLLFGVLFILVGLLGEYVARILMQVRQRPRFIVSEAVGFSTASVPSLRPIPGRVGVESDRSGSAGTGGPAAA